MNRNLDSKDEKIQKLKEEREFLEMSKSEQGNTIDETATLIRELRDKLLESQSDVNRLKRRLEGKLIISVSLLKILNFKTVKHLLVIPFFHW